MKITLNLATRPYADQGPALKRLRIGMAVLAVMLLALGFGLLHFHQAALRMAAQQKQVDGAIDRIRQEEQGYEAQMQQPANARVLQQAQFLNGLFDEKSFSWTAAMENLERVLPAGVQVTAIEPTRAKDGRLTLHLRISGQREAAVQTVRNMEHSRRFISPRISGENAENAAQGGLQQVRDSGRVTFDVLAEYNPATLDERKAELAEQKRAQPAASTGILRTPRAPGGPMPNRPQPGYIAPNPQAMPPGGARNPLMNRNLPPNGMPRQMANPGPNQVPNPGGQR